MPAQTSADRCGRFAGREQRGLRDASGFTLIELLVVMLIIAVLCAVAIPVFEGDKAKAANTQAKELARTAETTAETLATDNDGNYESVTLEELHRVEPTIPTLPDPGHTYLLPTTHGEHEYSITAVSPEGNELTIQRNPDGSITRECRSPVTKNGCAGGASSSW